MKVSQPVHIKPSSDKPIDSVLCHVSTIVNGAKQRYAHKHIFRIFRQVVTVGVIAPMRQNKLIQGNFKKHIFKKMKHPHDDYILRSSPPQTP